MPRPQENERLAIIGLHLLPEIGPARFNKLIERFGSAYLALGADIAEIEAVEGMPKKTAKKMREGCLLEQACEELEKAKKSGIYVITCADGDYPEALRNIYAKPPVIYVKGAITAADALSVAIVGTRHPTAYGLAAAEKFAAELAGMGVTVVSGLARGIDTAAHDACIASGGRTIAVLGNGLNRHYPPENRKLEDKIAAKGALVSEFPMDVSPDRGNFPRRNRLIAALSLATLVVEAGEKSGALITASCSAEQGKDVFAVPGPVFSKYSKGPHFLIKQGARIAESALDIAEELNFLASVMPKPGRKRAPDGAASLDTVEEKIMNVLESSSSGVSIDGFSATLGLSPSDIFTSLTTLEIKGAVKCLPGRTYVKNIR